MENFSQPADAQLHRVEMELKRPNSLGKSLN
jgi:hypothetical protein